MRRVRHTSYLLNIQSQNVNGGARKNFYTALRSLPSGSIFYSRPSIDSTMEICMVEY